MKNIIKVAALCFFVLSLSCLDKKNKQLKQNENETTLDSVITEKSAVIKSVNHSSEVYFKATGTEPFWSLEISEEKIKLNLITDSIIAPQTSPNQAMDLNVKLYKTQSTSGQLNVQISQMDCTNDMSGKVSPYSVSIEFNNDTDSLLQKINGCGDYITDYRLHDIWVLEELKGIRINLSNFENELPSMEINTTTNTFTGFAGCNSMNGKLFFDNSVLRFTDLATTKKMCSPNNQERIFLTALQSVTSYIIEDNRLWLSNPSERLLVFRKID